MTAGSGSAARRRILVRCPNWLGDVVMSTPGLVGLRRAYPEASLVGLLPAALIPLLEGSGIFDELWPLASRDGGLFGWRRDVARIASARFDLGIVIPESISSALMMRLGRVREVLGFARDPIRRQLLHTEIPAPASWGKRRLVSKERFVLRLLEPLGVEGSPESLCLRVTPAEQARLDAALAAVGVDRATLRLDPPVVIARGAGFGEAKCWPEASYAALADRLAARGLRVVLLGASGEGERLAIVRAGMDSEPIVLAGSLDLGAVKALLQEARLLVGNDAGARHVAAAFGIPSVIFFGPTSVSKTADNLSQIEILETEHACRPCYRRRCPIDHRCLTSIGVEEADAASERALERGRSARRAVDEESAPSASVLRA
jgi:heptosyltransferase-2